MAYKVTVNQPSVGKGTEVFIDGLGTFKNGESQVVSNAQAEQFRTAHGRVGDKGKWEQGPTLGQAFGESSGITVERVSEREAPETTQSTPPPAPDGTIEPMESTAAATTKKDGGKK